MNTNSANPLRHIVVVGYPGVTMMDASGPMQVFASACEGDVPAYRVTLAGIDGGVIQTDVGVGLESRPLVELSGEPIDTILVAGGDGVFTAMADDALVHWLRNQAARVRRVGSTCLGSFLLAATGLLDGRRAATHWRWVESMRRRFPRVAVDPDSIYIDDGGVWTSAGVSAGIDLALAMVEDDLGHDAALAVARRLVVYLKRPGGQSQFSTALELQAADSNGVFDRLHLWMRENLHTDLRVDRLAELYGTSTRTFVRHYKVATGHTPAKAVEILRVEAARSALEQGNVRLGHVARRCGFEHIETMRRSFLRCVGVPPAEYRDRFGSRERIAAPQASADR